MLVVEGGGEYPRLHGHGSSNEVADAGGSQRVSDLGFKRREYGAFGRLEERLQGTNLFHIPLPGAGGMAFHQINRFGPVGGSPERGANGKLLRRTIGLYHAVLVVARAHAGDYGFDACPPGTGQAFPLDDDHSAAFTEDHPVSFGIEGAGGLMSGPFPSRQPVECAHGSEFQKVQVRETILAPADDGGIDDAVPDHLDGAVQCHQ